MLKERLHLAESGKDEEVAKKVKICFDWKSKKNIFYREKSKGTYFSRREGTMML